MRECSRARANLPLVDFEKSREAAPVAPEKSAPSPRCSKSRDTELETELSFGHCQVKTLFYSAQWVELIFKDNTGARFL